jgi:hypothetical protein
LVRLATCVAVLVLAGFAQADESYASRTDEELTKIAADWEQLSLDERRALLSEVRSRMADARVAVPVVRIETQRRYGRIVRQPDGTVLHIERREGTVEYRPLPQDAEERPLPQDAEGRPFGIGFEHRVGVPPSNGGSAPASSSAPAIPVDATPPG